MSTPKNCHYISRFLTQPWETSDRYLRYYDFDTNSLKRTSSKTLFGRDALNDPETEGLLSRLVETPVGKLRAAWAGGDDEISDWPTQRALVLLLLLQGVRSSAALQAPEDGEQLARILRLPTDEMDQLVHASMLTWKLFRYRLHSERLFFPSSGIFPVPMLNGATADFAIAIPLDTRTFVALARDTAAFDALGKLAKNGGFYSGTSVGLHTANHVVIPPELQPPARTEAQLCDDIQATRRQNIELARLLHQLTTVASGMFQRLGIHPNLLGHVEAQIADRAK